MESSINFENQNLNSIQNPSSKTPYKTLFFLSFGLFLITTSVLITILITQKSPEQVQITSTPEEIETIPTQPVTSQPTSVPTSTSSATSSDWKTYTDSTYKFSINYPSKWTVNTKLLNNQILSVSSPEYIASNDLSSDYINIYFYKNYQGNLTNGKTLETYLSNKTDFLSFTKTKIANIDSYLADENGMSSNPYPTYFIISGDNLFEIDSNDQDFSETEKQIINSFKFN